VRFFENMFHREIARLVADAGTVVDLCCGMGHHFRYEKGKRVIGVDSSEAWLSVARRENPWVECIKADAENLPFEDHAIEAVVMIGAIEHIKNLDNVLRETKRILKKNTGKFVVGIPCEGAFYRLGRHFTTARYIRKQFKDYDYIALCKKEHCNDLPFIIRSLKNHFYIKRELWLPFRIPHASINALNIVVCAS
jgi:ubiquinone/menaquinone biosynthesis C-methylase UbiE